MLLQQTGCLENVDEPSPRSTDHDQVRETDSKTGQFRFRYTAGAPEFLEELQTSLLVTTYQAGKLVVLRSRAGRLSMLLRTFDKAMGLAVAPGRLAIGTSYEVWTMWNSPTVAAKLNESSEFKSLQPYDACYLPRSAHVTGTIDVHELAWGEVHGQLQSTGLELPTELWLVNTHFSCLCTLDPRFSFVPRWRPPFVTELAREDRCHMNGVAMQHGRPKYVTCFGQTNTPEGWRDGKLVGGCVLEIPSGEVVAQGLSMPHSPRIYDGRLWVLDSGRGQLVRVDMQSGQTETVVELPGYTRGLAFAGRYALIGLSKIRETNVFGGVPVESKHPDRPCGVAIVDIVTGRQIGLIEFLDDIREVFDVQLLPGARWPAVVGLQKEVVRQTSVVGPESPFL